MLDEALLWSLRTVLFLGLLLTLQSSRDIDLIQQEAPWTIILYLWWFFSILFLFNALIGMKSIVKCFFDNGNGNDNDTTPPTSTIDQDGDPDPSDNSDPDRGRQPSFGFDAGYMYIVGAAASAETLSGLYIFIVAITWNVVGNCMINWILVLLIYTLFATLVLIGELTNQTLWTILPLLHLYICLLSGNCWGVLLSFVMIYNYLIPSVNYEKDMTVIRLKSVVPVILGYTVVIFIMAAFLQTLHGDKMVKVREFHPGALLRSFWSLVEKGASIMQRENSLAKKHNVTLHPNKNKKKIGIKKVDRDKWNPSGEEEEGGGEEEGKKSTKKLKKKMNQPKASVSANANNSVSNRGLCPMFCHKKKKIVVIGKGKGKDDKAVDPDEPNNEDTDSPEEDVAHKIEILEKELKQIQEKSKHKTKSSGHGHGHDQRSNSKTNAKSTTTASKGRKQIVGSAAILSKNKEKVTVKSSLSTSLKDQSIQSFNDQKDDDLAGTTSNPGSSPSQSLESTDTSENPSQLLLSESQNENLQNMQHEEKKLKSKSKRKSKHRIKKGK